VYLQFRRFPHPVLGHELAHVISGAFGNGPFRVSGPLGGWLPDPGRIEGIATAATPDEDDDLTLAQWARAMQELKILPPLTRVFRLSFLGENSSKAYTVAGAFVRWFRETYGAAALRAWYAGATLSALTGKDLSGLEAEWHASLQNVRLDEQARLSAAARFDRPSVFGRSCPHEVDALSGNAFSKLRGGDLTGAQTDFDRLLQLDARHLGAKHGLASCALRSGDAETARSRYRAISEDDALHVMERMGAVEALGDVELALGNVAAARARYRAVLDKVHNADHRRSIEVKAYSPTPVGVRAVVALLVGDPRTGTDFPEAASWLGRWSVLNPEDGTADYLLGKNFANSGRYDEARARLDDALARRISLESVQAEAIRTRSNLACYFGEKERGAQLAREYLVRADVSRARRAGFARFARRCGFLPASAD
jgi:tetratricopeptide (TPR) repeat protein